MPIYGSNKIYTTGNIIGSGSYSSPLDINQNLTISSITSSNINVSNMILSGAITNKMSSQKQVLANNTGVLDIFDDLEYSGAKYLVIAKSNSYTQMLECLVTHHNHVPQISVYGLTSNTQQEIFTLDVSVQQNTNDIQLIILNSCNEIINVSLQKNYLI